MEKGKIIVGLDIGTTNTYVVVGRKSVNGNLEVLGVGKAASEGVVRGVINNIDKAAFSIEKAIKEAEHESNININVVNISLADRNIASTTHKGGTTREAVDKEITVDDVMKLTKDMYRIITPPGSEIVHVTPQDYAIDYEEGIKDPVGMSGVKLEADFHIVTAKTSAINSIHKCVKKIGLEIEGLIFKPLAASLSVLSSEEKEAGVCLIDIGGGTVSIAIFRDSIMCHCATLPFGSDVITEDIKQGCTVMTSQAELLKTKFGTAIVEKALNNEIVTIPGLKNRVSKEISVHNLATIIEARMEEIISFVNTELIDSGYHDKLAGGIVITGGGAELKHVSELFENIIGIDTRIGCPNECLEQYKNNKIQSPSYATVMGLVMAGFKALDYREEYYRNFKIGGDTPHKTNNKKEKQKKDFFKRVWDKTRGLLMDDVE